MAKKYEKSDLVNVRLSLFNESNTTKHFSMWTNRPVAMSPSIENGSVDQENVHGKKNISIRFEAPSVSACVLYNFSFCALERNRIRSYSKGESVW